jgi:hypothetical protein
MAKKLIFIFTGMLISLNICLLNVSADETEAYYTNSSGVSMTEDEYNFFGEMFWDGYQEYVTLEQYNKFQNYGYFDSEITKVVYDEELQTSSSALSPADEINGTIHETTAKRLTLVKVCGSSTCGITVTLTWKGDPTVKSYDVIGALLYNGLSLASTPTTYLKYDDGIISYSDPYYVGGGFGTSVKLQSSDTAMKITQSFDVSGTGVVYASYQHARKSISKATSKLYTVGYGGDGGVFHFYGAASDVFDQMGGVNTVIS